MRISRSPVVRARIRDGNGRRGGKYVFHAIAATFILGRIKNWYFDKHENNEIKHFLDSSYTCYLCDHNGFHKKISVCHPLWESKTRLRRRQPLRQQAAASQKPPAEAAHGTSPCETPTPRTSNTHRREHLALRQQADGVLRCSRRRPANSDNNNSAIGGRPEVHVEQDRESGRGGDRKRRALIRSIPREQHSWTQSSVYFSYFVFACAWWW